MLRIPGYRSDRPQLRCASLRERGHNRFLRHLKALPKNFVLNRSPVSTFEAGSQRQSQSHCSSLSLTRTIGLHSSPLHFYQMTHDRQTQSQPLISLSGAGIALMETIENIRQEFCPNAYSRVADLKLSVILDRRERDFHSSPRRSKLNGIRQKIPHHLLQASSIA